MFMDFEIKGFDQMERSDLLEIQIFVYLCFVLVYDKIRCFINQSKF